MTARRETHDIPEEQTRLWVRGRARPLAGLSLGYLMVLLDTTVLAVAEPDLSRSLGASVAGLQWVVDGYTITLAAFLLSAGALTDRLGAQRTFRYGTAAFGLLSLLTAFAPSIGALITLRALLGAAAAVCIPSSLAMISRLFPEPSARSRALAVWTAISGAGLAVGPLVGGTLVSWAGWRVVFLINVPLAILVLLLVAGHTFVAPRTPRRIDFPAHVAAGTALALASGSLITLGGGQFTAAAILFGATAIIVGALIALERRSASPVFDPRMLGTRGVGAGLLVGAVVNFALTGVIFALPLLLAATLSLTPFQIGLFLLPLTIPCAVNPLLTGHLVARVGTRLPVVCGLALVAVGTIILAASVSGRFPGLLTASGLLVTGFGISFAIPALISAVLNAAPDGTAGTIGGILNAVRQMGATFGVAVMGATIAALPGGAGGPVSLLLAAGLAALGCVAYAWLTRRRRPR